MPIAQSDPFKVQEISHLKRQSRAAEALELLKRVALQVQPIMRKRQWTVKKLSEFIPKSNNLLGLNVNRGAEVKIRLRPPGQEDSFYSWNHILGTMLHELCHNKIGPHNAAFYKLLDELWTEAEDLMDRGITGTGQGFDAASVGRLGSHSFIPTHNPPEHKMADAVRKAAEARAQKAAIMPTGPQKLGGSSSFMHMTPAQAAAAAAERRARDNMWCGAEHSPEQVEQELGSRDASPAVSTAAPNGMAANTSVAAAVAAVSSAAQHRGGAARPTGLGASNGSKAVSGAQVRQVSVAGVGAGSSGAMAAAAATATAGQAAVLRQQTQQDINLQQQWQEHVQQQRGQRQGKKRPAAEAIDLTLSEDEDADAGNATAVPADAAGAGTGITTAAAVMQQPCSCPCCNPGFAELEGSKGSSFAAAGTPAAAAGGGGGGSAASFRVWCARRRQWLQEQQLLPRPRAPEYGTGPPSSSRPGVGGSAAVADEGEWVCPVCTLVNKPLVLQCEACLTQRHTM